MKIIKTNERGSILPNDSGNSETLEVILVDNKESPLAKYEFNKKQLLGYSPINYESNNCRIFFL